MPQKSQNSLMMNTLAFKATKMLRKAKIKPKTGQSQAKNRPNFKRSKVKPEPEIRGLSFGFPEIPRTRGVEKFRGIGMPSRVALVFSEVTPQSVVK